MLRGASIVIVNPFDGNLMLIRVDVDSLILKFYVPHIEVVFDLDSRRLLSYRGVSMISDESGHTTSVTVTYEYHERTTVVQSEQSIRPLNDFIYFEPGFWPGVFDFF